MDPETEDQYKAAATTAILEFMDSYIDTVGYVPIDEYDYVPFTLDAIAAFDAQCGEELDALVPTEEWMTIVVQTARAAMNFWKLATRPLQVPAIEERLARLSAAPQYAQRTRGWYIQMLDMLSASDARKITATEGVRNALIRAKCAALPEETEEDRRAATAQAAAAAACTAAWGRLLDPGTLTVDSRLWGQRYEPVSKQIYIAITGQELLEFGRIPHPTVPRFGASPDAVEAVRGYNVEFKSVVSRILDGGVVDDYYYQMQSQMECCDLPWTNFCETKFSEVELLDSLPAVAPPADTVIGPPMNGFMGAIWIVSVAALPEQQQPPRYLFSPPCKTRDEIRNWSNTVVLPPGWQIDGKRHWILEQFVMQGVARNPRWWADFEPEIARFWKDVDHYRVAGCESIAAKPRNKATTTQEKLIECDADEFGAFEVMDQDGYK